MGDSLFFSVFYYCYTSVHVRVAEEINYRTQSFILHFHFSYIFLRANRTTFDPR